ncbi:glycoside hydrolase/phage tail family protein [Acuticoccus sp. I52.16.1]|uniref:baseplate multidomain protein megatron n=1 Tax=Acuticoccus sp. I52.16.1 TaxID=2928472 RepID=UPI001FD4DBE1|nr:glycoside hydrolase/phage tail family protein [Acuticoccus sp. I52.16.1]UOM33838.1 glycoside hydrolase/phage tail family protein [Acuticoccus sp. I52.16.1]
MATLVLQAAGQAVGGLLGPVGAIAGRAAGALAGNMIDHRIFGDNSTRSVGRIDDVSVQTASEGNPIPKVYGRMRLAGTVIWATDFEEHTRTSAVGGKGGGPKVREYSYTANFAVGICEGPIARVGRIWADGEPMDLAGVDYEVYTGRDDQEADPLIEAVEGTAPAYRGLAYVVFKGLPIGPFGNRLPQLTFEVLRPIGQLERDVRAVTIIPGSTEFGYHPDLVRLQVGPGEMLADNRHIGVAATDFTASLDELTAVCPNLERVALVVAWFGTDLRAGECALKPRVERREPETVPAWSVSTLTRDTAEVVSADAGRPNYGGSPSDASVFAAIQALKARGLKVVFYPFVLMDVPPGNGLPDPYLGEEQAPFPWRGRITVSPAPGEAGSPDGTAAADAAVATFVGTAAVGDFGGAGADVSYGGPEEWSFRRMMLHYARLTAQAGGVDAFLVGSELPGLTTIRGIGGYPFVDALVTLIDDVRSIVGGDTQISYAADWTEYFGHSDGADLTFHLDPVWASANVDFIGIDNYWPLSDWRDGTHLDEAVAGSVYDPDYLAGNVAGGEGYDWYYQAGDRAAQVRSPIQDLGYGKPWVYRYKDLAGWWANQHYDRIGGVEVAAPTAWVPQSKPVWFTELGCPAIDRGSNQPNVFFDPKSSESKLPYYSSGRRDDGIQRAHLRAFYDVYEAGGAPDPTVNPVSSVYGGRMVDASTIHIWTWDARPWPMFPHLLDLWSDGTNWERGHWLNGRLGGVPVDALLASLFEDWGLEAPDVTAVPTVLDGFIVSGPSSLRSVVEPLLDAVSAVAADTGTAIRVVGPARSPAMAVGEDDLVEVDGRTPLVVETRDDPGGLPVEMRLRYFDSGRDFQIASARYRPQAGSARQVETISLSASLNDALATELAELALAVRWSGRTTVRFALPQSRLALAPGDIVTLSLDGTTREVLVEEIEDLGHRLVTGRSLDRAALAVTPVRATFDAPGVPVTLSPPATFGMNLPLVDRAVPEHVPWIACYARPFPEQMGVWQQVPGGSFQLIRTVAKPASMGVTASELAPGPAHRWHRGGSVDVRLFNAAASSAPEMDVLSGANALAIEASEGLWEVVQYRDAVLIGDGVYRLSVLLRGQLGTEDAAATHIAAGARVVMLDRSLASLPVDIDEVGLLRNYRVGPLAEGIGGPNTTEFTFTATGRGMLPFAPAHGRARRESDGALTLSWVRRTRVGGDRWGAGDVPLGESAESYRLEILDGETVVRTVTTSAPTFSYALADQTADFGGAPDPVSFRVGQYSPGFALGTLYEVTVDVQQS